MWNNNDFFRQRGEMFSNPQLYALVEDDQRGGFPQDGMGLFLAEVLQCFVNVGPGKGDNVWNTHVLCCQPRDSSSMIGVKGMNEEGCEVVSATRNVNSTLSV